jgi:hypothetical protein
MRGVGNNGFAVVLRSGCPEFRRTTVLRARTPE